MTFFKWKRDSLELCYGMRKKQIIIMRKKFESLQQKRSRNRDAKQMSEDFKKRGAKTSSLQRTAQRLAEGDQVMGDQVTGDQVMGDGGPGEGGPGDGAAALEQPGQVHRGAPAIPLAPRPKVLPTRLHPLPGPETPFSVFAASAAAGPEPGSRSVLPSPAEALGGPKELREGPKDAVTRVRVEAALGPRRPPLCPENETFLRRPAAPAPRPTRPRPPREAQAGSRVPPRSLVGTRRGGESGGPEDAGGARGGGAGPAQPRMPTWGARGCRPRPLHRLLTGAPRSAPPPPPPPPPPPLWLQTGPCGGHRAGEATQGQGSRPRAVSVQGRAWGDTGRVPGAQRAATGCPLGPQSDLRPPEPQGVPGAQGTQAALPPAP
ncbi:basic proline-rich protein-like [Canis lupus dingo]|uniref:basic proline-rich protein-like n=1 Tax=Canis lupus dingo TaxID=286419 RepID=UPI000DC6715F|nr:basic proline-rich protein-like [Canis lupus dingo]